MKKLLMVLILFLFSCSEESDFLSSYEQKHLRNIAYKSLSEEARSTIVNWQNGKVEAGIYHSSDESDFIVLDSKNEIPFMINSTDVKLIERQKLVAVTFNTTYDALLGPLILIIELREEKVIGLTPRM